MDLARELLPRAFALALTFSRAAGFAAASPFPGGHAGPTQRVGLALALTLVAGAVAPSPDGPARLDARLAAGAASEVLVGALFAVAFRFVFAAAEVLSQAVAQASGLASPSAFNPTLETQETALGQAVTLFATLVALAVGAHRVAIAWVLESFRALPVGASVPFHAAAPLFVDLAADSLAVGLRLALPVVAVALAAQSALALIARAAPSLQLFSVGLTVLVAAGVAVLMASLGDVTVGLGEHFATLSPTLERLFESVARRPP
jgi:flagellar biosynthetic protein FliR